MVVQVGDKVLVYGAGTPWAFAKKIEPAEVGDTVDVVTLSDGTKLAMPKIELDLSDYVWVFPEWDIPFNIGDIPFRWGMMPLGAAVFTLTDVIDCWTVEDNEREWGEDFSLAGCLMIILTGQNKGARYRITAHSNYNYSLTSLDFPDIDFLDWVLSQSDNVGTTVSHELDSAEGYFFADSSSLSAGVWIVSPDMPVTGIRGVSLLYKFRNSDKYVKCGCMCNLYGRTFYSSGNYPQYLLSRSAKKASTLYTTAECTALGISPNDYINPSYPDYDVAIIDSDSAVHTGTIMIRALSMGGNVITRFWFKQLAFLPSDCITVGLSAGDKYIIYNPETKRLVFNDATKTIFSAPSWRDITYPGEIVTHSPVEYVWDGQGQVYLSQSKTTNSTIFYDNELRVEVFGDTGDIRVIDYHSNDPITYSGETVSRELVNITSILRAGKNYVQLKARDTGGTKVGFPTPIYIKRGMS